MLPVRCFTCNKVLGYFDMLFEEHKKTNLDLSIFFEKYNIKRYCCKKIFMCHIDIYENRPEVNIPHVRVLSGNSVNKILKTE